MADYRKMWEELGMDVELHDQLCAVLPQAFGDVFLSQENRPDSMDYYNMVVADIHGIRPAELIEHQKKGGKVFGTFCVYVPDEIVFAADAIATGLCGGSRKSPSEKCLSACKSFCRSKTWTHLPILPYRRYVHRGDHLRRQEESMGDSCQRRTVTCDGPSSNETCQRHQGMGRRN